MWHTPLLYFLVAVFKKEGQQEFKAVLEVTLTTLIPTAERKLLLDSNSLVYTSLQMSD